ncbi:MAG: glutamine synthetase family protein [Candidatus Delongbacteria bacterium]|jgi:glutamine synthetase|nr:glutamine synthetase family protein [Candidatus Delongbacteria bacterium]
MNDLSLCPNKIAKYLNKLPNDFTKSDIIKFIVENEIIMLNFRYVGGDGRLKTLNFIINGLEHLEEILTVGERVDGSSLFTFIDAVSSDLYVVPRYKTAFVNPFSEIPTVDILCSFYTADGKPLEGSPGHIVKKAHKILTERTGYTLEALGELEYYLFSETDSIYPIIEQKGYHESHPFAKWGFIRIEAMKVISEIGGSIKYGHAEVGNIINGDLEMVQHEIEFLPVPIEEAADQLALAKWAVREIAYKYGLEVSYAPKIMVGQAGSGLHIHMRLMKDGKNAMKNAGDKGLTEVAKKLIAGLLNLAPSLTAFGNTVPTSYLRLVPHQEAPTKICWGDRNRSVLVRVPLGWQGAEDIILDANPLEVNDGKTFVNNQTVEIRNADGSANVHQLLAGITVAVLHGLELENGLEIAKSLYVTTNASAIKELKQLPASCSESGDELEKVRDIFQKDGIFPEGMISRIIKDLKGFNDFGLSEMMEGNTVMLQELVDKYLHCG